MPKIAIIVLNWNGKKDTLECLSSLQKISYPDYEVIVIDNGSHDDSVLAIERAFPSIEVIKTHENLGFAEGNNVGIRHALAKGADLFFLLNNDTVVDSGILTAFTTSLKDLPYAGILGAKIYLYDQKNTFDHLGGRWNPRKGVFDLIAKGLVDDGLQWEIPQKVDYACGAALLIKREVFEKIGELESKFFLIWEESDFCARAQRAGFLTMTCPEAKIWHKVSASFVGGKPHSTYFWWRNRLLWIERNCSSKERLKLFLFVLLPEITHLYKLKILKTIQLKLLSFFTPKKDLSKQRSRVLKYRAACQGIQDYALRRFGNGPAWIYGLKKR